MASDVASPDPRSKLHSLVRLSGPFLGADLPPAERRAQVLSRMPLAAPARSAGSSWTRPSTALCLSSLGHQHRRKQRRYLDAYSVVPDPVKSSKPQSSPMSGSNSLIAYSGTIISLLRSAGNSSCKPLILLVLSMEIRISEAKIDEFPCIFPAQQGIGVRAQANRGRSQRHP